MPLPTPNTNESKDDFIDRCMANDTMNEEFPETDQRRAVCETQWDEAKNMTGLQIKAKGENAEIMIYDDIGEGWLGGISAKTFADEVKKLGSVKDINVRINSYGGSVFDGLAIYNTLKNHKARITVNIDGIAASIASIVAMAGDEILMAENGFMMIHDPWMLAAGTADDLRETAGMMDKIRDSLLDTYMKKATMGRDEISDMMAAETWLTAGEALDAGLATTVTEEIQLAAHVNPQFKAKFKHIPDQLNQEIDKTRLENSKILSAKMNIALRNRKI